jgi:hypothetical protein
MEKVWIWKGRIEDEPKADREFWQQMTGRERVAALEELREDVWKFTGESVEGLRRAVRVLQRPEG